MQRQLIPEGTPPAAAGDTHARGSGDGSADDGAAGDDRGGPRGPGLRLEFAETPAETEAHSRLAVLARLAPYCLTRHVIASGKPIDHESYFDRTTCAALFIDISGFSKMTEKLVNKNGLEGAEQLARHLNINLGRIVDRLTDCGADVIKFAGDAALCIFPVVEGGPDLAAQTLRATQLSLECISTLERENYVVEGIRLTAHSGLGCGDATGFFAGGAKPAHLADARTEYTPIGAPMTQIASSEPAAGDGETVVSPECWSLIGHQCNGRVVVDEGTQEKNYLVTSIKPEFQVNLDDGASGGITDELHALSATEASAVADQIAVVVPEAVRAHLTDLVPGAIPNIAEFRSVTVLFSRLTGLDYSRGQSELQKVQRVVRLIQETIYKYGGQLMRFSVDDKGAVVLGVFGLPPSNQDDPERGVLAAMEFCQNIEHKFDGVRATVGITTGYCFSGLVGGVSRCEYTTHGPLVNLAARLMVASERDALVDTATKDRCHASSSIEFTPMPAIKVKGREEPVPIFVPRRVAKVRARVIARSATMGTDSSPTASPRTPRGLGGKTPRQRSRQSSRELGSTVPSQKIIGRQQECELIRKVFAQVEFDPEAEVSAVQPPLCVLIEGEAGIGKSELCREAMHYAQGMHMDSFWTAGHADTVNTALRPFRCVIRGLFYEEQKHMQKRTKSHRSLPGASDSAGREQESEKFQKDRVLSQLTSIFASTDCPEELRKYAWMFYAFVTALPCESKDLELHAPTMVKLIVYWLAERCTHHGPTLLVLDDAQWLDPTSWALCEALAASEQCRGKLVLVFASRPIAKHSELAKRTRFLRRSLFNHLELQPMTKPDLIEIVKKRLESDYAGSASGSGFAPSSPASKQSALAEGEVVTLDSNDAIKTYMQHFDDSCVHVGGLGDGQEEDDELEDFFSEFGTVYGAIVRVREGTNRSWGIVSFASPKQALAVITSDNPKLARITRRAVSRQQALRSTGSLLPVYKQQLQKVQLRLQRKLLQTEAHKLTAGGKNPTLSKKDVRHLLGVVGVEMSTADLNSVMRLIGDGDAIVAELQAFYEWWAANGFDLTQAANATYRMPREVVDAIKQHPSSNPLRMLLLARELIADDQPLGEDEMPQSPASPHRPRRHLASDGSLLHTDEDTAGAIRRMLRRLSPDEQHVLQLVAACGADCSLRMIQTMQHELDALQSVASKHTIDDRNIVPTFNQLMEKRFLNYPGSLSVISDTTTGHVNHLLFAEKIVEEVVLSLLHGAERHVLSLATLQRYLFVPVLHREQLARNFARTENGSEDAVRHLCSAGLEAIEMQADGEAAHLCSEIIEHPALSTDANESIRIRWMTRFAAAKLRSSKDRREMAAALQPVVETLTLCEMQLPIDPEDAAAKTSLLLRGGQVAIPAPRPSLKPAGPSASKLRFRRLARKATHNHAGMVKELAESAVAKKQTEASAALQEDLVVPRWMMLTDLYLLLASSAKAAGMWALHNYATVASLRLLEARGQMFSAGGQAVQMGARALANASFGSAVGKGAYNVSTAGDLYQSDAEAALAARVHSTVAASARRLGVQEWARQQQKLAREALEALSARTAARADAAAKSGGRLPRDVLEAEWETHRNLAQCHLACANLDDGLEEIVSSCRYSHTAGVEESRKEEALYTASWLVFWANGPIQAHECFCGDELAVSAERRGDDLMLARILCGQALCEMHIRVDSQEVSSDVGTSISECLDSAEEHLNAYEATIEDADGDIGNSKRIRDHGSGANGMLDSDAKKSRRRTSNAVQFLDLVGDEVAPPAGADSEEIDGSQEESGAARVQLADRRGLGVFIRSLRCLNMLWAAKNSPAPEDALLIVLPNLQPLATQVASDLLTLTRDYEDEEVLARPEYVEGFGALTTVLLEIAELRAKQGQRAIAQTLRLTAFHCALAAEHFSRFFAGASPLAANLRASCAVAQSEYGTARTSYLKAIDAVTAMKHVAAGSATAGGLAGESAGLGLPGKSTIPYAIELCRAETGLAGLDLQAGDSAAARKRLETALRRLQQAGSVVLARQVERMCAAISD